MARESGKDRETSDHSSKTIGAPHDDGGITEHTSTDGSLAEEPSSQETGNDSEGINAVELDKCCDHMDWCEYTTNGRISQSSDINYYIREGYNLWGLKCKQCHVLLTDKLANKKGKQRFCYACKKVFMRERECDFVVCPDCHDTTILPNKLMCLTAPRSNRNTRKRFHD